MIPSYNCQRDLESTLASLDKSEVKCDVFVIDDGSFPPLSLPPCSASKNTHHLLRQDDNLGITSALNVGLKEILEAGFDYIARIDAGDLYVEGRFSKQLDFLENNPDHAVVGTWASCVTPDGETLFDYRWPPHHDKIIRGMHYNNKMIHPSVMMRASMLSGIEHYSHNYPWAEDYEFFFRLGQHHKLANIPERLLKYEINPGQITNMHRSTILRSRLRIQLKFFAPWKIHSWLGLFTTLITGTLPRKTVVELRRRFTR